jgi:membrane protease YdiL (CAAX protease family)
MSSSAPPPYLRFLPAFLFRVDGNPARYIVRAWLLSMLPAILIAAFLWALFPDTASAPSRDVTRPGIVLSVVVIAPILETLIMGAILLAVQRAAGAGPAVLVSAIFWGAVHGWVAVRWGLAISWSFLIFSVAFVTWRQAGLFKAFLVAAAVHASQNGAAILLLIAAEAALPGSA